METFIEKVNAWFKALPSFYEIRLIKTNEETQTFVTERIERTDTAIVTETWRVEPDGSVIEVGEEQWECYLCGSWGKGYGCSHHP